MAKIKVHSKTPRFNMHLITSFGDVHTDEKGCAEIDEENLELALQVGFEVDEIPQGAGSSSDVSGDDAIGDSTGSSTDDDELIPEKLEAIKISLLKKKNNALEAMLVGIIPEEEYKDKIKKDLVGLVMQHIILKPKV